MNKDKQVISANLETEVVQLMDEFDMNRSQTINKVLGRELGSPTVFKEEIQELKNRREDLRERKQEIERQVWELDDKIENLQDQLSKAQTINDIKNQVKKEELESVLEDIEFAEKNQRVPKAKDQETGEIVEWEEVPGVETVIKEKSELLSEKYNMDAEEVEEMLKGYSGNK